MIFYLTQGYYRTSLLKSQHFKVLNCHLAEVDTFFQAVLHPLAAAKTDLDHRAMIQIAIRIFDLPDKVQHSLPVGQTCIDLYVCNVHQYTFIHGANIYISHCLYFL